MRIKGHYCFKQNGEIILEGDNLITLLGESFFLNRAINNQFEPIQYIVLGTGSTRPKKTDVGLSNLTAKKKVTTSVDLNAKQIILNASFEANEVINTSEIGVSNDDILISHDIFNRIGSDFLSNSIGKVDVEYTFKLTTGAVRKDFIESENYDNVYWIAEPTQVVGVSEEDTHSGYVNVGSIEDVKDTNASYYYSRNTKNLYIHTSNNNNPNLMNIILETK